MDPAPLNSPRRTCPFCAEDIGAAAKVCPRCRQWLTWRSVRHPAVLMCLTALPLMLLLSTLGAVLMKAVNQFWNPAPYYTEFPDTLQVLESQMHWVQTKEGLRIFVTGILTNTGPTNWRGIEMDCRFYNAAGTMVDAANARPYLTIGAHDDSAFRAAVVPGVSSNEYQSFKLSVSTARNARSLF
jgi:hypothetical protein